MRKALERGAAARGKRDPSRFVDVRFEEMIDDPLEVAARIYARIGADFTDRVQADMKSWLSEQPGARPSEGAELDAFDVRAEAVRADFAGYAAFAS
jgi:hypothetical protein